MSFDDVNFDDNSPIIKEIKDIQESCVKIGDISDLLPLPTINGETEEKIKHMFRMIQSPFEKHCPRDRTIFLSHSYILHKFFQLLRLDEFTKYFPLLKSREKLKVHDSIWEKICDELTWKYYPSI